MSDSLQIRLLGEFSVAAGGKSVSGLNSARIQSLLVYLLRWLPSAASLAYTRLRSSVWFLRRLRHQQQINEGLSRLNETQRLDWSPLRRV